jgi:hypothetical protein
LSHSDNNKKQNIRNYEQNTQTNGTWLSAQMYN